MANININYNSEKNGIEITFVEKPDESMIQNLKVNGFRWSFKQKMWYAKQNDSTNAFVSSLEENGNVSSSANVKTESTKNNNEYDLFAMTRVDNIDNHSNEHMSAKDVAAIVRAEVKSRFPMVKFSVRSGRDNLCVEVTKLPFAEDSAAIKAIIRYVDRFVHSYEYYESNYPYDGASYNFVYCGCRISYDAEYVETTVYIQNMVDKFNASLEQYEAAEREKKEKEIRELAERMRIEKEQLDAANNMRTNRHNAVENGNIKVVECEPYFIDNLIASSTSKLDSISEYEERVDSGREKAKIFREVYLTHEQYEIFSNQLMDDWSFLKDSGGSATDDNRINSMMDYLHMSSYERKSIVFYPNNCVLVFDGDKPGVVVDAQGYDYCRYIYRIDNETVFHKNIENTCIGMDEKLLASADALASWYKRCVEKVSADTGIDFRDTDIPDDKWPEFKKAMFKIFDDMHVAIHRSGVQRISENDIAVKKVMYRLFDEDKTVARQFERANFQAGERLTIVRFGDFGGISIQNIVYISSYITDYAQHKNIVAMDYKVRNQRSGRTDYLYKEMFIYRGWLDDVPENVLYNILRDDGVSRMRMTKYSAFDLQQFDAVMEYYNSIDHLPVVNNYNV